jgi:hypothetical protein
MSAQQEYAKARDWVQRHTYSPDDADDFAAWFIDLFDLDDQSLAYDYAWDIYRRTFYGDRG